MKGALRFLRFFLCGLIVVVALGCALFGYFVYSPAPEVPRLSGTLTKRTIEVGGLKRTYLTYVPRGLAKGAPLVVVMHGSDENGARIRIERTICHFSAVRRACVSSRGTNHLSFARSNEIALLMASRGWPKVRASSNVCALRTERISFHYNCLTFK